MALTTKQSNNVFAFAAPQVTPAYVVLLLVVLMLVVVILVLYALDAP